MTPATAQCPERIAPAILAAWRDGALPAAEAARIAAHAPECPACRAELATYDSLDTALRRQPTPEPDGRLWRAVRDGMAVAGQPHRAGASARRLASGLAALAAVVLLALGFAQVLHSRVTPTVRSGATATASSGPKGTPTPLPTAVPASPAVDGPRPSWQQARLPIEPLTDRDILTYGVVPDHGDAAYACHATSDASGATLTFYHTADRAQHWTTLAQIAEPHIDLSECMVQVDALDGGRVLVELRGQNMQDLKEVMWYELTEDGGATWTRLDDSATIYGLSTLNGKTYALRVVPPNPHLSVSTDHLRTWQPVDEALVAPYQGVTQFWVSPGGELLAQVSNVTGLLMTPTAAPVPSARTSSTLWRSSDGGAHWDAFPTPTLSSDKMVPSFIVGQPAPGQPWHICAQYEGQDGGAAVSLACTFDGGRTWSARPLVCTIAPCAPASPASLAGNQYALAGDGAVVTMALAPGSQSQLGLYRLPQGSTTWQYLGPTFGSNAFFFATTPDGGILWAYAGGTYYYGRLSGSIGGQQSLPGVLSTATYP